MLEILTGWLLNYLLHSTVLLGGVWLLERAGWLTQRTWREAFWRWAFFGAVLTASAQPLTQATRIVLPELFPPLAPLASAAHDVSAEEDADAATSPAAATTTTLKTSDDASHAEPTTPSPTARDTPRLALGAGHSIGLTDEAAEQRRETVREATAALLLAWPLVALAGLAMTLLRWLALRRQVRALALCEDAELTQAATELARNAGVAVPTLRMSALWPSPLVAPGGQICLPAGLMRSLEGQQRVAVLAHEIAHLRRRDLAWRLAARLVAQLGWLQPLNRLAMRRLDLLAELACDAWAAEEAGAMPLAQGLYVCARDTAAAASAAAASATSDSSTRQERRAARQRARSMPVLASAMAAARSPLMARMHALLEESPMSESTPARRRAGRIALAAGLCTVALAVPMLVIGKVPRISIDLGAVLGERHVTRFENNENGHVQRASYDGDVVFNDDETDVVSLDKKLEISETLLGVTRRAVIASDGKGGTTRRYWVDGDEKPLDAEGRKWLTGQIGLVAEGAHGSEYRARRLLQRGGTALVLADIERSPHAFVRRSRLEALLSTGPQDDATLSRLIAVGAKLDGDFERRSALDAVINHRTLTPALQREVLTATAGMQGAFERREVLEALSPQMSREAAVVSAWQQAVQGIEGDFEKRSAITALIEAQPAVDRDLALSVLGAVDSIGGDFERAQVLVSLAERMPPDAALIARYRQSARGLSTHERGRVEEALDHLTPT
ncbi:M56 family metallopeptidase [Roseateles sp. So40a]|uniref:M56 family metallopeptidase n=1 Tax=Roseateles sp. So40a TaxID=3400226 RepID=UPI003A8783CC